MVYYGDTCRPSYAILWSTVGSSYAIVWEYPWVLICYTMGIPLGPRMLYYPVPLGPRMLYYPVPLGPHMLYYGDTVRSSYAILWGYP